MFGKNDEGKSKKRSVISEMIGIPPMERENSH